MGVRINLKSLIIGTYTQEEFAHIAGVTPATVGAWCRGAVTKVDLITLGKICKALGIKDVGKVIVVENGSDD